LVNSFLILQCFQSRVLSSGLTKGARASAIEGILRCDWIPGMHGIVHQCGMTHNTVKTKSLALESSFSSLVMTRRSSHPSTYKSLPAKGKVYNSLVHGHTLQTCLPAMPANLMLVSKLVSQALMKELVFMHGIKESVEEHGGKWVIGLGPKYSRAFLPVGQKQHSVEAFADDLLDEVADKAR